MCQFVQDGVNFFSHDDVVGEEVLDDLGDICSVLVVEIVYEFVSFLLVGGLVEGVELVLDGLLAVCTSGDVGLACVCEVVVDDDVLLFVWVVDVLLECGMGFLFLLCEYFVWEGVKDSFEAD